MIDEHQETAEAMLKESRILLRSADPAQRERGREKLREVLRVAEGSVYAREAIGLLTTSMQPVPAIFDPELARLMDLWETIQGFNDHRLADFLGQLETTLSTAMPLRTKVIRTLKQWIADALPQVLTKMTPPQVAALDDFVAAVRGVAAYEELPEFEQLRDQLFQLRLRKTSARVDELLKTWALDDAWQVLDALGAPPPGFVKQVNQLQADVYAIDDLRRAVQGLHQQMPAENPANWFEARLQTKMLEQVRQYLNDVRVPPDKRLQLEEAGVRLAASVEQFIHLQALASVTVQQLRDFQTKLDRLSAKATGRWQVDGGWFQQGLEALTGDVSRNVERARQPDELTATANALRAEEEEGLPPVVAAHVRELADVVGKSAAAWKAMRDGQVFELPNTSGALPTPAAWSLEAARYADWLQQIEAALSDFRREMPPASEQDFENGLRLAKEILAHRPNHALAHKLHHEARRRIACNQLDRALTEWDLDSFFDFVSLNNPGEIYAALTADKEALFELKALTRQAPLTEWQMASEWWVAWRAANRRLPSSKPDSLLHALAQQSAERQSQWYASLDKLLKDRRAPQEYEQAADALAGESDTALQTYRQELGRKVTIRWIEEHIAGGRLAEAELALEKLSSASTDAVRLRTNLQLARARASAPAAAAEFLCAEWNNVWHHVEHPHEVLLETVRAAWAEGHSDRLAPLLSRVLSREESENATTRELADWQTWLEIEEGLLHNFSSAGVKRLADYLRVVPPGELLNRRLTKVLRFWEAANNTVMLAWASQAFRPRSRVAEEFEGAADDLVAQSDAVAEQVLRTLAEQVILDPGDIQPLQASLRREEERWHSLGDFLGLYLPHPVVQHQPSATFAQARAAADELALILTTLARLKGADLRQEAARLEFEGAHARALRLDRDGVASRPHLLAMFERLHPLLDLFTLQERMRETAERCRSKAALDVLEPGLFAALAAYVGKVVETFVRAEAREGAMWRLVSVEYEAFVFRDAGVLLLPTGLLELDQLVTTLEELHEEESEYARALTLLEDRDRQPKVPWGGTFDPEPHLDYLRLIPSQAPRSLKVYHRFDRARRDTFRLILEAPESRPHLPNWVREYLEKGVPACANLR